MTRINSSIDSLINRRVMVLESDAIHMTQAAQSTKVSQLEKALLLEFGQPSLIEGKGYRYAIASPRLERDDLTTLLQKGSLSCGVTWVPEERFNEQRPFDLSWWRGGAAAITDIVLSEADE